MKKILFSCFLLTQCAYAIEVPRDSNIDGIFDFSGGLNTQRAAHRIGKNQTPNAENGLIDEKPGSIVKRNGYILAGSTNVLSKVNFMMEFVNSNNQREMLVSDSSQVLTTKDFSNYTLLKATLSPTAVLHGTQGRGKALLCNGVDPCFFYDGSKAAFLDGANGYPTVPIGKYPAFYLDRFWVGNTTASNSSLQFSEVSSTDGFAIDPLTDFRAWPAIDQINIGLGDGKAISGLDTFRYLLQIHKDNGAIYTLQGTDPFTFTPRRNGDHIGTVSQDSIAQSDNFEHYIGKDGVYRFDGINSERISDDIFPDIQAVVSNISNIQDNTWDTQSDFIAGGNSSFNGTTVTATGLILPLAYQQINDDQFPSNFTSTQGFYFTSLVSSTTGNVVFTGPNLDKSNIYNAYITSFSFQAAFQCTPYLHVASVTLTDLTTGLSRKAEVGPIPGQSDNCYAGAKLITFSPPFFFNTQAMISSNVVYKIDVDTVGFDPGGAVEVKVASFSLLGGAFLKLNTTTGSYTSQITTITNVNFWDQFNTVHNTNGGSVTFYIKGGTAAYGAISTETWTNILPGSIITIPTNKNYVQWAATISASDISNLANIDKVVINHNASGSLDSRPIGFEWKKRYWLMVTTQTSSNSSLLYVKSRITNQNPNAWMKFTGINVRSVSRLGDNLYAGASDSGSIYRLDYGTNDNGTAINWFYDTPELTFGDNFLEKIQQLYLLDCDATAGANLTIGASVNGGAFNNFVQPLDGSGRLVKSIYSIHTPAQGIYFKYRFSNSELDKSITLHNFGIVYTPTKRFP